MRFIIVLLISFIPLASSWSMDIQVMDGRKKYQLILTETVVRYKDELTDVTLSKKECSAHLHQRFEREVKKMMSRPFLDDFRPEFLKIDIDGKVGYEPRYGHRAKWLLSVPVEMKKLKIEESLNCNKK